MTASTFLRWLHEQGVAIAVEDGDLVLDDPDDVVTIFAEAVITSLKQEIVALVQAPDFRREFSRTREPMCTRRMAVVPRGLRLGSWLQRQGLGEPEHPRPHIPDEAGMMAVRRWSYWPPLERLAGLTGDAARGTLPPAQVVIGSGTPVEIGFFVLHTACQIEALLSGVGYEDAYEQEGLNEDAYQQVFEAVSQQYEELIAMLRSIDCWRLRHSATSIPMLPLSQSSLLIRA